jgi:hypothetical protein
MSAENQDQDFEKLQRLLKLKRHESPPPRFFNDFSGQVTARIRAGDVGRLESIEDVVAQAPWLQRLWQAIEGKPAVSGIFTAAVCALVVAGMFIADKAPPELPKFTNYEPTKQEEPRSLFAESLTVNLIPVSSTNPAAVLPNSLFNNSPMLQTLPASFPAAPK